MRKRFIHLAAALLAAAVLWPLDVDARPGGRGGGGIHGGGMVQGGGGGFAGRGFSGGGMRGGFAGNRAFAGGSRAFAGGSHFTGHRGFHHRGFHHRGFHGRRFVRPAFVLGTGLALGYGAYAYDPYWHGYYDDDCIRWVRDWHYGWRQVNICY